MTKTSESLMQYTIVWSVGFSSLGGWFGSPGPVIGAVLGAALGIYVCLTQKEDPGQDTSKPS